MLEYNRNLKNISRNLRNNMTEEEIILWSKIKSKKSHFSAYGEILVENDVFWKIKTVEDLKFW